ncbi:MAG: hypothetical protein WA140_13670 [Geobacteraceae bacterium]
MATENAKTSKKSVLALNDYKIESEKWKLPQLDEKYPGKTNHFLLLRNSVPCHAFQRKYGNRGIPKGLHKRHGNEVFCSWWLYEG